MGKKKMLRAVKIALLGLLAFVLSGCGSPYIVLDPKGPVGEIQANLIILSTALLAAFIVPVLVFFAFVVIRYRDKPGNRAAFKPEWDDNKWLEIVWWGIPILVIGVLSFFTVRDTFALAGPPSKSVKPVTIQVASLDWKWLFLYPEQGIATVNYVKIPTDTPVRFELTSDAPINSFWVPQLGGQRYTLPGKVQTLWLQADETGTYYGTANNFSGEGFTAMKFDVIAEPARSFNDWAAQVQRTAPKMGEADYETLRQPGIAARQQYGAFPPDLFGAIVNRGGGRDGAGKPSGSPAKTH